MRHATIPKRPRKNPSQGAEMPQAKHRAQSMQGLHWITDSICWDEPVIPPMRAPYRRLMETNLRHRDEREHHSIYMGKSLAKWYQLLHNHPWAFSSPETVVASSHESESLRRDPIQLGTFFAHWWATDGCERLASVTDNPFVSQEYGLFSSNTKTNQNIFCFFNL